MEMMVTICWEIIGASIQRISTGDGGLDSYPMFPCSSSRAQRANTQQKKSARNTGQVVNTQSSRKTEKQRIMMSITWKNQTVISPGVYTVDSWISGTKMAAAVRLCPSDTFPVPSV
ncbi:hypothetical protein NQZ68_011283 [Dissostichus eleginoides]|nr:hypothetical protein NQZ68_011283 [Dissostichus eleginoides]